MAETAACSPLPSTADDHRTIFARQIPGHQRLGFLPRSFGPRHYRQGEAAVFSWMGNLCPEYSGGFWQFYELSNGGFYLALDTSQRTTTDLPMTLLRAPNGFEGAVSFDAAGIVATMYAINGLIWQGAEHLDEAFYQLRDFAVEHRESRQILCAVD
ncbi:antirestriction protein [Ideonella sp. YS5]|uniref:antirestriction protein n=1 Tax=Ideonella sp. YS5 TaxID=3453714 RepID=UPI003EEAB6CC